MPAEACIIDGYVDEPACLGVPPSLSPYVRTCAGVLAEHGYTVAYRTIDQLRCDPSLLGPLKAAGLVLVIAGATVPGKYLGGTPATLTELRQLGLAIRGEMTLLAGPIGFGYAAGGGSKAEKEVFSGYSHLLPGSPAEALDEMLDGRTPAGALDYSREDQWSVAGAGIIAQHPDFPHIICELETARGCPRSMTGGCSFCTEPLYGPPVYRSVDGVAAEVEALAASGARHFRLGRQPDLLSYGAADREFPEPRPDLLLDLFARVREAAPDLRTLHIDNVNPGTIARHPDASREALGIIIKFHTPGDVAAFGMETADPVVIGANNLKATPDEVMEAIRIVNEVGAARQEGIPGLLPGLNFVCGLDGETADTYRKNEEFLAAVLESDLLVRRVNIRQLMPFPGTWAYDHNTLGKFDARFRQFKEFARTRFDHPMLARVFPVGTVLRDVVIEQPGNLSFGRQLGSYPILVGIPLNLSRKTVLDAVIVDHGSRSVTALPCPVEINRLPVQALRWIPGIGKKRAGLVAAKRPFRDLESLRAVTGTTPIDGKIMFETRGFPA